MSLTPKQKYNKWIVNIKGSPEKTHFEISVLRENNAFGQRSYGWFDYDKLLISHNGGPCGDFVIPVVWDGLVELANKIADQLNASEEQ